MNSKMIWGIVLLALSLFLKPILSLVALDEKLFGLYWQGETVFTLNPILVRIVLGIIGIIMLVIGGMKVVNQKKQ